MSGRKASEVSGLLSRGSETRRISDNNTKDTISICNEKINNFNKEYQDKFEDIKKIELNFSKESQQELSTEVDDILDRFKNIKSNISIEKISLDDVISKNDKIEKNLLSLDEKTKKLYERIRNKNDYCDNEYREATEILQQYKDTSNKRNNILNDAKSIVSKSNITMQNINNIQNELKNLTKSVKNINNKAIKIVEVREKASEIKLLIEDRIDNIQQNFAQKFLNDKYKQILKIKEEIKTENDNSIIKNFTNREEKISLFINELDSKIQDFERNKLKTNLFIQENKNLLVFDKFYDPLEYTKKEQNASVKTLLDFLSEYADDSYIDEISKGIEISENLLLEEKFKKSKEKSKETRILIEKAISYANVKQENLIKNIILSSDIREIMKGLSYKVKTSLVDNHIKNGLKITCMVGDETIDFDKVFIDDTGEVTIDIDHTESVTGTCQVKWEQLQKEFVNNGIMLQDVTKNGNSVIYRNKAQISNKDNNIQQRG